MQDRAFADPKVEIALTSTVAAVDGAPGHTVSSPHPAHRHRWRTPRCGPDVLARCLPGAAVILEFAHGRMEDLSCAVLKQCVHEDDVASCQAALDDGSDLVKVGVA